MRKSWARVVVALGAGGWMAGAAACGSEGRPSGFDPDQGQDASAGTSSGGQASSSSSGGPSITPGNDAGKGDGGSSSGGAACATATTVAVREPVYLDVILDGSGSMDAQIEACGSSKNTYCAPGSYTSLGFSLSCFGDLGVCRDIAASEQDPQDPTRYTGKKWIAARESLKAYFDATAPAASASLGVGLSLFSSNNAGQDPIAVLDAAQATVLWNRIKPQTWPDGVTPLRASIDAQATYLRAFSPQLPLLPGGRHVILLITDGVPVAPTAGDTSETKDTVKAAVSAALAGTPKVETAVIGVGDPTADPGIYDETFLSQLGQLGGLAPAGCKTDWAAGDAQASCHLQVTPGEKTAAQIKDEMVAAINSIAGSIASCELALDKSSPIDPTKVNVLYTNASGVETQVPQDATNGWTYDDPTDPTKVVLHGTACDALHADAGQVNIVIGCPTGTTVIN